MPVTPLEEDCCHNGCNPCIFDVHAKLLEEWKKKKKGNMKTQIRTNLLCPFSYKNFIITDIKEAAENYILLSVKYQENEIKNNVKLLIKPGHHVMLHLQEATRSFTPIHFTDDNIQFLIRLYDNGKFSTCIRHAKIGDEIRIRGPYGNFKYKCNSFQNIIMFCMGSGITAMYPVAKSIIDNELEETRIHFIGCFQKMSQVPLKKELQIFSDYWNFKCTLYISQLQNEIHNLHGINIKCGHLNEASVHQILRDNTSDTTLVLICGSQEFDNSIKQWTNEMDYKCIHVFE
ncbi:NADH-cytochrome b5 reductase-like isoform X2 [Nomia melanderi]|uniref:NADH-cytochrome b5 reductase-like isoform X2 n=1 Tax=Nomia melanderi TaxID=2448451 RepID=UPI0013044C40|nr:NADH-cytochrome b5 reductase-like isoform X2 [Nomia melanderi]